MIALATAHGGASAGDIIIGLIAGYWWVLLLFGGAILEAIGEFLGVGFSAIARLLTARSRVKLKIEKERRRAAEAELEVMRLRSPGQPVQLRAANGTRPCLHRHPVRVYSTASELVGWACRDCPQDFPPDAFALAEDVMPEDDGRG